jgi:MFS family permease
MHNHSRWSAFAVLLVGAFLPPLDFFIVNVALPSIQNSLHTSAAELQLVISGYASAYAVFLITGGRLGDLFGRRKIFLYGISSFGLTSVLCGLASSPALLIVGRLLQGLSAAAMAPQGLASIHALFPEQERARALGLYGAAVGLAAVAAQALGGALISADFFHLEWRIIFLINLPIVAAVLIFGFSLLPDVRGDNPAPVDKIGMLLCALTLALLIVPLVEGRELGWPWWSCAMLVTFPLAGICFWKYEIAYAGRGGVPLISVELVKTPGTDERPHGCPLFLCRLGVFPGLLRVSSISNQAESSGGGAGLPAFRRWRLHRPVDDASGDTRFREICSRHRHDARSHWLLDPGHAHRLHAPGRMPAQIPVIIAVGLLGFGQGWALPTLVRSVINRAPATDSGMIAGITNSALQISAALGVAVMGGIFFTVAGASPDAAAMAKAFAAAMLCVAASLSISAVFSVVASRSARPAAQ